MIDRKWLLRRIVLLIVIIGVSSVIVFSYCNWDWLVKDDNSAVLRNIALIIGGIFALYALTLAAIRNQIMQENQISENLSRATEQFSNIKISIRILAISSLRRIALTSDNDTCQSIINAFCAHIRKNHPIQENGKKADRKGLEEDMLHILNAINIINTKKPELYKLRINLSMINFSDSYLAGDLNLSGVELGATNLSNTELMDVNLSKARLFGADFSKADLSRANLSEADFSEANLPMAKFIQKYLNMEDSPEKIPETDLTEANLDGANMSGVIGLETVKGLETVINPPPEIIAELERRKNAQ